MNWLLTIRTDVLGGRDAPLHETILTDKTPLWWHRENILKDRMEHEKEDMLVIRSIIMAYQVTPEEAAYLGFDTSGGLPQVQPS